MNETKQWYKSKTLWGNLLMGLGSVFSGPMFGHVFAPEEVGAIMGIGNIVLRLTTDKGLTR